MEATKWLTPYSIKTSRALLVFYRFQITFEGDAIYEVFCGISSYTKTETDIKAICAMLNGAYNMGYQQGMMHSSFDKIKTKKRRKRDGEN